MKANPINPCTILVLILVLAKLFSPYAQEMSWWVPGGIFLGWATLVSIIEIRTERKLARLRRGLRS